MRNLYSYMARPRFPESSPKERLDTPPARAASKTPVSAGTTCIQIAGLETSSILHFFGLLLLCLFLGKFFDKIIFFLPQWLEDEAILPILPCVPR